MAKKKIPQIVKDIRNYKQKEMDWANEKLISYSQLSMFNECRKKWSLNYVEGHKQFSSTVHTVFGTAIHEVIQHYLTVMYEQSAAEADRLNTSEMFEEALRAEYKIQYKKNGNQHFCTPEQLREFFDDGISILRDFAKNKNKHFSKRGWYLVGCEVPVSKIQNPTLPNVVYQGYLDVVMYHEPTDTIKIIDIKTSTNSWSDKQKKDENKQFQLILYKKFISEIFNHPIDQIEIEFFIVKRKLYESEDFVIRRIQTFSPPSGKVKLNKATQSIDTFINEAFDLSGYKKVEHQPTVSDGCKWCPFQGVHLCSATYNN
jgi:hypothetical protein